MDEEIETKAKSVIICLDSLQKDSQLKFIFLAEMFQNNSLPIDYPIKMP